MGCDIHLYKEKFIDGKWLSADEWVVEYDGDSPSVPWEKRFTQRNYKLFGLLSKGVRHEYEFSLEPRGMPISASPEVSADNVQWDSDGHSHSYLYLHELKELVSFLKTKNVTISGIEEIIESFDGVAGENHRIVFWFDN